LVRHSDAGVLSLSGGGFANFYNRAAGTYDFSGDGNINDNGTFFNAGLVRKSAGARAGRQRAATLLSCAPAVRFLPPVKSTERKSN
jgi:hypothetical protein